MELVFLVVLFALMVAALAGGFPVAFALPGSAILSVLLAGVAGDLFFGDQSAFFAQGNPREWLSAGVTNFRGLYWDTDRDTLIAIPLFIFMGLMLQRSKIAEDLLVTMAQLFGSVRGGLGISVVLVGALLAATTGIVGATVVAMGLISLPAMLRNRYDPRLATGTICAAGTLGQIIPPSIVLIILADQLASAADQASAERKALYRERTGEFSMPSELDIVSTSAGEMFRGAIFPGLVLVGLYVIFILTAAWLRPRVAPPVHYEGRRLTPRFLLQVALTLIPPLILIFAVLGSILLGVATVNQAGAIGAVGATIMAGWRLYPESSPRAFYPAGLAALSLLALWILSRNLDLNIRTLGDGGYQPGFLLAVAATLAFATAVVWSGWRVLRTERTLHAVMEETAKTTSMVFIILLGAAMLTAAFRAFGGEEIVRHALGGLPGGFWAKFFVVMFVMFLLGFFLDFIEIAVVVVPIVAPILLADPSANVTAVWLGVIIAINLQTSFLTPPFGFALFYLRGVAPRAVKTLHIYRGVAPFIALQLLGLVIIGLLPPLVNYLPNRAQLTGDLSPPPRNPRLQSCIQELLLDELPRAERATALRRERLAGLAGGLPSELGTELGEVLAGLDGAFAAPAELGSALAVYGEEAERFRPMHREIRRLEQRLGRLEARRLELEERVADAGGADVTRLEGEIRELGRREAELRQRDWPEGWDEAEARFGDVAGDLRRAQVSFRRALDGGYSDLEGFVKTLGEGGAGVSEVLAEATALEEELRDTVGLRLQERLPRGYALRVARCRALPEDIALSF
ncbi:MAG: TRAP transporter large permease subunit [Alphaproteobacteria bacterium]|nr:TRAP transporter large permease subunit [Alphaproteobacteria bacterium]MDA7988227.1 TRAP transporter large permease subunit [Alphaproteobacteria bacterium]